MYVSTDCEEAVGAAYLQQFNRDFTAFLNARAREMVDGGCMFIAMPGRNAGSQLKEEQGILGNIARHLEYAFEELVNEVYIMHSLSLSIIHHLPSSVNEFYSGIFK